MELMYQILLAGVILVAVYLAFRLWQTQTERSSLLSELNDVKTNFESKALEWKAYVEKLRTANQALSKYQGIVNAEAHAREIIVSAEVDRQRIRSEAEALLSEARQNAKASSDQVATRMAAATQDAKRIVDEANARAVDIAGDAYKVMKDVSFYEQALKALKNKVQGYGDEYIIPPQSLLDSLAEETGHTEAGVELKRARDQMRQLIGKGNAAACDYVEANRSETAIRFVIDAFNGKVDSILSRVKSDNAGKLEQEIRDAFHTVNLNGRAFRNARITEEYMAARLLELRWAAVAQLRKLEEREEQRRIKELIREEEKARREYERAIRDAAKEEDMLRKAMAKAREQLNNASDEQRQRLEQQLAEMVGKLREAEAKNQRALSMAQQTKRGHVYVISNIGSFGDDIIKIGLTRRLEPLDRIRELGDSSVPFEFDVHALIWSEDAPSLENTLHKHFIMEQVNKVNYRKEFFRAPVARIREDLEKLGLEAKWTMTAAAREYRETLAIERAIQENPEARESWRKRQLTLEPVAFEDEAIESAGAVLA